jgi:hypothetical protein
MIAKPPLAAFAPDTFPSAAQMNTVAGAIGPDAGG